MGDDGSEEDRSPAGADRRRLVDTYAPGVPAEDRCPPGDLYKVFFSNHVKFQYPPSSLMVFNLFPPSMTELVDGEISERLRQWLSWLSRAAVMMPKTNLKPLEESFRAQVFRMLKKKRKLTDEIISNLMGWRHSGFSVHMPSGLQETIMRHGKGLPSI